jgi:ParB-like chromosome segregation protein Spo0J
MTSDKLERFNLPVDSINVEGRIRQDLGPVEKLAESISKIGLIQPIVIDRSNRLVAGGRRWTAVARVLKLPTIDCVYVDSLSELHLRIMEVEENTQRHDLSWQERCLGIYEVHRLMSQERLANFDTWTGEQTSEMLNVSKATANNAIYLAKYIIAGDQKIIACSSAREAFNLLSERRENEYTAKLAKLTIGQKPQSQKRAKPPKPSVSLDLSEEEDVDEFHHGKDFGGLRIEESVDEEPGVVAETGEDVQRIPLSKMLHLCDCREYGKTLPDESIDHIITDIPYAIDMRNLEDIKNIDLVKEEHEVEANLELYESVLPMFYRVLKDKGFCVMWYDLDHHSLLHNLATKAGFRVQRWPLIWCKTHPCKNNSPQQNFTKNYECVMVLRKGNATLVKPQTTSYDIASADREMKTFGHPFVKPNKEWQWLYSAVALQGQLVWDPFAGVGSSTLAAIEFGLRPLACELVEVHYNKLVVNVRDQYERLLKNVRFE